MLHLYLFSQKSISLENIESALSEVLREQHKHELFGAINISFDAHTQFSKCHVQMVGRKNSVGISLVMWGYDTILQSKYIPKKR